MQRKRTIAIVGPGSLGTAIAYALYAARFPISEIVSRDRPNSLRQARKIAQALGAKASTVRNPMLDADIVWLCVPDGQIKSCAKTLSSRVDWRAKIALHSSGALSSNELQSLHRRGASVASVHPLMTFVSGVTPSLSGVPFAIEGDLAALRVVRRIVSSLGGEPFVIAKVDKPAYHAWGAFLSPLLIAALVTGERVAALAGIKPALARRRMSPIVRQTLANYLELGASRSFSGPIIRGDTATVAKHLRILRRLPEARRVYVALAHAAVQTLPTRNRRVLERMLR